jgi:glycine oxidase
VTEIAIVGGGIVGLACAYELATAGAKVTLFEYGRTGMQATNAAAGMLAPLIEAEGPGPMFEIGVRALEEMPSLVDALQAECGFEVELRLDGILRVAYTPGQFEALRARQAWLGRAGHDLQVLDAAQCREAEPKLTERAIGGLYSSGEGSVSNQLLALALERGAIARGVEVRQRSPVEGFRGNGDRVTHLRTAAGDVPCDAVVIAAGARSGQIAAMLPGRGRTQRTVRPAIPVRPIRGQMIALGGMSTPIHHVVWGPDGYLVPRANGLVFAGATVEDVGFRRRTTRAGLTSMRRMANTLVPQLAAAKHLFEWSGLRPGTPDGLPIIGPLPGWSNVIAATGHYRNGILLGPITGQMVARGVIGREWDRLSTFTPARFV